MAGAILNTLGKFAVAAFTPVFLNIAIIAAAIWLAPNLEQPEYGLAWGVFFGGLIQLLFQIPFLKKAGLLVKPQWGWNDPGVTKIRKLMLPAIFGVSVSQINLLLDTLIASFLMTGSISWLYYSDRLLEFPLGLFGIAIATVILPALSSRHVDKSPQEFTKTLDWGIRMVLILGVPAMAGLFFLAEPMLMVLFMHGAFSPDDARMASYSLMAYSAGLLSFMLVKVLATGFYSRQDTKRPVKFGIIAMVANMVFNIALAIPFSYVGLAMATAASAAINAGLLGFTLHKEGVCTKSPARHLAFSHTLGYPRHRGDGRRHFVVQPRHRSLAHHLRHRTPLATGPGHRPRCRYLPRHLAHHRPTPTTHRRPPSTLAPALARVRCHADD